MEFLLFLNNGKQQIKQILEFQDMLQELHLSKFPTVKFIQDNSPKNKNYKNNQRKKEVKSNQNNPKKMLKVHNKFKSKNQKQKDYNKNGISYHNSKNFMQQIRILLNHLLLNLKKNKNNIN